jgi:hypothetical protein
LTTITSGRSPGAETIATREKSAPQRGFRARNAIEAPTVIPFSNPQKEDKIRILKQRLAEREQKGGESGSQLQLSQTNGGALNSSTQLGLNQGKDSGVQIILPEPITSDFDSAFGNGFSISVCTRSSEIEFSEGYL